MFIYSHQRYHAPNIKDKEWNITASAIWLVCTVRVVEQQHEVIKKESNMSDIFRGSFTETKGRNDSSVWQWKCGPDLPSCSPPVQLYRIFPSVCVCDGRTHSLYRHSFLFCFQSFLPALAADHCECDDEAYQQQDEEDGRSDHTHWIHCGRQNQITWH